MQNSGNERYQGCHGRIVVPAEHYGVWSSVSHAPQRSEVAPSERTNPNIAKSATTDVKVATTVAKSSAKPIHTSAMSYNQTPKVQPRTRQIATATPYRRQTRHSGVTLDHMTNTLATPRISSERQHIMQQAAIVRKEAKRRAEAAANAELKRQLALARQVREQEQEIHESQVECEHAVQPMMTAQFEPVPVGVMAGGGNAPVSAVGDNPLANLMSSHVTINFKFNKERILQFLRYVAVAAIVLVSGYLAYDTYMTNKAVRATVSNGSSAASIAGTNPATVDQTAVSQEDKAAYVVPDDQPRYLYIPAIGLNQARVMSVGVNSKGNIDTPRNLNDTAWYDGSAKPGQNGAVFIDGHTSFNHSLAAAFNDLPKLKSGDTITIEKGNGERINYTVHSAETVAADKVDMSKALNTIGGAKKSLTLMTCAGKFNYRTQTADKRFIIYAIQN